MWLASGGLHSLITVSKSYCFFVKIMLKYKSCSNQHKNVKNITDAGRDNNIIGIIAAKKGEAKWM